MNPTAAKVIATVLFIMMFRWATKGFTNEFPKYDNNWNVLAWLAMGVFILCALWGAFE